LARNSYSGKKEEIKKCRKKTSEWLTWHYAWDWKLWWGKKDFLGWHLLFPRLIASVLTAWITIIIGSDLLPAMLGKDALEANIRTSKKVQTPFEITDTVYFIEKKEAEKEIINIEEKEDGDFFRIANINGYRLWIFIGLVIFVIQILTYYSIISKRKNNKYKGWLKYFWFIFLRPLKILLISFIFSVFFGSFLANMFSTSVPLKFDLFTYLQNPFFISCVFLAMLIGIVLRLATDEKYTEE
jgi:hypothetical protein